MVFFRILEPLIIANDASCRSASWQGVSRFNWTSFLALCIRLMRHYPQGTFARGVSSACGLSDYCDFIFGKSGNTFI